MNFKSPIVTYIGAILAVVAIVVGVVVPDLASVVWGLAGILGFGSALSFATWIKSKGWKRYATAIPGIILGILLAANLITVEIFTALSAAFGALFIGAAQSADVKVKK